MHNIDIENIKVPEYKINKEVIARYLEESPLNLLSISDNKPINFNLKISKQDLGLIDLISSHGNGENYLKKSDLINHVIESLIIDIFDAINDDYVSFKMASTVDEILESKHNFSGREKFSWVNQFIGDNNATQIIYNNEVDPNLPSFFSDEYKTLKSLLVEYKRGVLGNENSK